MSDFLSSEGRAGQSPELVCGSCGTPIPPGRHFCPKCLAPASKAVPADQADQVKGAERVCGSCGTPIPPGRHFCPKCLAPASKAVPAGAFSPPSEEPGVGPLESSTGQAPEDLSERAGQGPAADSATEASAPPEAGPALASDLARLALPAPTAEEKPSPAEGQTAPEPSTADAAAIPVVEGRLCPDCSAPIAPDEHYCPQCGAPASTAMPIGAALAGRLQQRLTASREAILEGVEQGAAAPSTVSPPAKAGSLLARGEVPSPPPDRVESQATLVQRREAQYQKARRTFFLAIGAWILSLVTWGSCAWIGLGLAVYCLWQGRKLQRDPDPEVAKMGRRAVIASAALLVVGGFLLFLAVAGWIGIVR